MVRQSRHHAALIVLCLALFGGSARAEGTLVVGTKPSPPFAMKSDDGQWTGISIELWRQVAADLHVEFEIKEFDLKGLLDAVERKQIDVAVGSTTITAEREQKFDFTHPI